MKISKIILALFILMSPVYSQWISDYTGLTIYTIHTDGQNLFIPVLRSGNNTDFYFSEDLGETWSPIGTIENRWFYEIVNIGDTLFTSWSWGCLHVSDCSNYAIYTSNYKESSTWTPIFTCDYGVPCLQEFNNKIIFQKRQIIYQTSNCGLTWDTIENVPASGSVFSLNNILFTDSIYKSTDEGISWSSIRHNLTMPIIYDINENNSNLFCCAERVFRMIKGSNLWEDISPDTTEGMYYYFAITTDLIAVASRHKLFLSRDNGNNWTDITPSFSNEWRNSIFRVLIKDDYIFLATDNGLWRGEISNIVSVKDDIGNEIAKEFSLSQNYPNPFNPTTVIRYTIPTVETGYIPSLQYVVLKIFDVLGREIQTLVNDYKSPGTYEVEFDGKDLASGIYFYTLRSGKEISSRKMVLLR
ncbi:MAG: T9SS type A sorting domain-containing protein [bacterium]